jgi:uncharacterized protein YjbI with pentapeptide repeats
LLDEAGLTNEGQSSIRLLAGVDIQGAQLRGIDLVGTDLIEANLSNARGITTEQLEKQTENLRGAFMPDRSQHP